MFQQILFLKTFPKKDLHPMYHLLSAYYMPGTLLGTEDRLVKKPAVPALAELMTNNGKGWALVERRQGFSEDALQGFPPSLGLLMQSVHPWSQPLLLHIFS